MEKGAQQPIIIKKGKGHGHGHHGGSWKVALADFMTAMMAFFMLMWLLGSTTKNEQKAISSYFQDPGSEFAVGQGGASPGIVEMEKAQREAHDDDPNDHAKTHDEIHDNTQPGQQDRKADAPGKDAAEKKEAERVEKEHLDTLQQQIQERINDDPIFQQIKDQILMDVTALGLRIQIVDKDQRPMFDSGSAHMKPYSEAVMKELASFLNKVQNKISITGHTDATPYGAGATYTNWELSADRANAARRALQEGGFEEEKVATVQGMGSSSPMLADNPTDPINRRIAIIVLKKAVADALNDGGRGVNSEELINTPGGSASPSQHIMTQKEIDAETDAKP